VFGGGEAAEGGRKRWREGWRGEYEEENDEHALVLVISITSGASPSRETRLTRHSRTHDTHTHTHTFTNAYIFTYTYTYTFTFTLQDQDVLYFLREHAVKYQHVIPQREIRRQSRAAPACCPAQGLAQRPEGYPQGGPPIPPFAISPCLDPISGVCSC
jgi:hypothetical protein